MQDYTADSTGELRESKELIRAKVQPYLEKLGPNIPILKSRDTALGRCLLAKKSALITYENITQVHAHIRAALWQYVRAHYNQGDWRLDYLMVDSSTLISAYLGGGHTDYSSARLVNVPLLIVEAPTWQRTKASKDHAATLLKQRLGARRPTWIYSWDFVEWTTGCSSFPRSYSQDLTELLGDNPDFEHITLVANKFRAEIKDPNGFTF